MQSYDVVIPFFNDEAFFEHAFASAVRQTVAPRQIRVVVDGRTAAIPGFFDRFDDPRLFVDFIDVNCGSAVARNRGVRATSAELVAFLDADDEWHPEKMERQLSLLARYPGVDAVHTGVRVVDAAGEVLAVYDRKPSELRLEDLLRGNQVLTSSLVIRRHVFEAMGGFDARYRTSQDFEFVLRAVIRGASFRFLPDALTSLRRAGHGNISSRGGLLIRNHLRLAWQYRRELLQVDGLRGYRRFIAKYLVEDGARMRGLSGRLLTLTGRVLNVQARLGDAHCRMSASAPGRLKEHARDEDP